MTNKKGEQGSSTEGKNRGWPKGKRRYPKGAGAPKQPLSGYVHFLNERRDSVRGENPDITFSELSKKLAAEWSSLPEDEKSKYNEMAKIDKNRYDKEFADYQNTDQYKNYLESQKIDPNQSASTASVNGDSKAKKKKKAGVSPAASVREETRNSFDDSDGELSVAEPQRENSNSFDIPIFTEEFLDHNKARELELKQLRKQTGEFEEQNAVLGKHIESMKSAITKLEVETVQQRQNNAALQHQLDQLRQLVVTNFKGLQIPGVSEPLSLVSADNFISVLHSLLEQPQSSSGHSGLASSVKDIISNMDFSQIIA